MVFDSQRFSFPLSPFPFTRLHASVHATLRQRNLLPRGRRILVAVSGGQDSLCLLKLLLDLQSKWDWQIAIAHCDHRWQTDVGIAEHVQNLAKTWQIPFYLKVAPVIEETEAAARTWRYQALVEIAQAEGLTEIVTGHTLSDRAETLLYNLLRGAGSDGLSALVWKRPLTPEIQLVRPLLKVSRRETLEFCQQFALPVWEDAANQKLYYARNRIRTQLLPYLQDHFNPQVEVTLAQTADILRAEGEYLESLARQVLEQAIAPNRRQLNRVYLRDSPLAIQRRVMRRFLAEKIKKSANFEQIEALTSLINAPNRTCTASLPGKRVAEVQGEWIVILEP